MAMGANGRSELRAAAHPRAMSGSSPSRAQRDARRPPVSQAAGKPPAGSAVALASERRGSSLRRVPIPAASQEAGRSAPRASARAVLSSMLPRGPETPPRHPRNPSPSARHGVERLLAAPKEPAPPKRPGLRSASPRVRAMAARVESPRVRYTPADQGEAYLSFCSVPKSMDTGSNAVRHTEVQDKPTPQRSNGSVAAEVKTKSVESPRSRPMPSDGLNTDLSLGSSNKAAGTINNLVRHAEVQDQQTKGSMPLPQSSDSPVGVQAKTESMESPRVRAVVSDSCETDLVLAGMDKASCTIRGPRPLPQRSDSPVGKQDKTECVRSPRVRTPPADGCETDVTADGCETDVTLVEIDISSGTVSKAVRHAGGPEVLARGPLPEQTMPAMPVHIESMRVQSVPAEADLPRGIVEQAEATSGKMATHAALQEKPAEGLGPYPHRDHRPVATPRNSTRSCQVAPGSTQPHRGAYVAELWLRLARIALLEFTKLPPPHRIVSLRAASGRRSDQGCSGPPHLEGGSRWMSMAFPSYEDWDPDGEGFRQVAPNNDAPDVPVCTPSTERALQAWSRIIFRVMGVTMAGPNPCAGQIEEAPMEPERTNFCRGLDLSQGHANICLGDMMEESVTWIEVDFEDDQNSPRQCDPVPMAQEESSEDFRGAMPPDFMPTALRDIYRQQNAPGIAGGIQKCLSF
mmetsp:Transcript_107628/g.206948  ORF Transcript_107628/g.206948 Transcript_107628/m.206948 type:complete len:688 (-) Transcript_107628:88-2151(-)